MKITVLSENVACCDRFECEHGLSFYIETAQHKILFDMGASDLFIRNAEKLGVNLKDVDIAFLSHGHYDHGGGLPAFLNINSNARIYINEHAFSDYFAEDGRYLGIDKSLSRNPRIVLCGDQTEIDGELSLFTGNNMKRSHYMDTFGLFEKCDGKLIPDRFLHEQYLMINENSNKVLISGCSHKGILNIMEWADKPSAVIGGFHYMLLSTERDYDYLYDASKRLSKTGAKFYTCHCTGISQYNLMKDYMKDKLDYLSAGQIIKI